MIEHIRMPVVSPFSDNLNQHPFSAATVKLTVIFPLPGTEVQSTFGNPNNNFATYYFSFYMGIGIILTGVIMSVPFDQLMRGQSLEPGLIIVYKPGFVIVDENRCSDMHNINQA